MKTLLLLVITLSSLFCAKVDETYYSISNYEHIETAIEVAQKQQTRPISILEKELFYLKRIKEISEEKINFERFDEQSIQNNHPALKYFYNALEYLSHLNVKISLQEILFENTQNKLGALKNNIENIVEENKNSLALYQLQFLYYKLQKKHIEEKLITFKTYYAKTFMLIQSNLFKINPLDLTEFTEDIASYEREMDILFKDRALKEIELEKENVIEDNRKIRDLSRDIYEINNEINNQAKQIVLAQIHKILYFLSQKQKEQYIYEFGKLSENIEKLDPSQKNLYSESIKILNKLAKEIFGKTDILYGMSLNQMKNVFEEFKHFSTKTLFVFNEKSISVLSLIKGIFILFVGFTLGLIYKRWVASLYRKWPNMSQMSVKLSSNIGFYILILITIMITMSSLGIDMSSISLIAGALSIGIGFGLQTVVSNFIAGIILMFERTIRIGDIVEISDVLKGMVTDIRIRSTTIKTFDNIDIVIPNSSFIQNNVINWTLEDPTRRLHVPFAVAYGTKVDFVKEVIIKELLESDLKFIKDNEDKKPEIRMENMNSSSVDFELLVWVKSNDKLQPNALKSDFMILIYNTLYKYNIEIPFPQLDLHVKENKQEA